MPGTQEMENLAMVYYIIIQAKHVHTNHKSFFTQICANSERVSNMRFRWADSLISHGQKADSCKKKKKKKKKAVLCSVKLTLDTFPCFICFFT